MYSSCAISVVIIMKLSLPLYIIVVVASAYTTNNRDEIRVVLMGKTGNGKSATGNSILSQKKYFVECLGPQSATKQCKYGRDNNHIKDIVVVDTPGFADTQIISDDLKKEIVKCIGLSSPGPHALIYVMSVRNRLTEDEIKCFIEFYKLFGDALFDYTIFVVTSADSIEGSWPEFFQTFKKQLPDFFQKMFIRCGKRAVLFNNKYVSQDENEAQVQELFSLIGDMTKNLHTPYFTNEMVIYAEEVIQKRISELKKQNNDNYSDDLLRSNIRKELESEGDTFKAIYKALINVNTVTGLALEATAFVITRNMDKCIIM